MTIEFNKIYRGSLDLCLYFNNHRVERASQLMLNNGSVLGNAVEYIFAAEGLHDLYVHAPGAKGYDFRPVDPLGRPLECKTFTKTGLYLAKSASRGAGRTFCPVAWQEEAPHKDFLIVDTTEASITRRIKWIFVRGFDIVNIGHRFTAKTKHLIFNENTISVGGQ